MVHGYASVRRPPLLICSTILDSRCQISTNRLASCLQVRWLSFHSGYDFGYMLRMLTDMNLPEEEEDFFEILRIFFPSIYDVKYLMKSCKSLKGGLQEVADQLELERIGASQV